MRMPRAIWLLATPVLALLPPLLAAPARAEVVSASPSSFEVSQKLDIPVAPGAVWSALLVPGQWWDPVHSWSHDAHNLTLEPRAGGCFCETLPATTQTPAGSVEHMRVLMVMPGKLLRMSGALGPLQGEALVGTLTIELEPLGQTGTRMSWTYVVGGFMRMDGQKIAPVVDMVLGQQAARLRAYASHGGGG
jgi:uncharacterized protein YndB with AHSA1/START domain